MYKVTVGANSSTFDVHTSGEAKAAVEAITREGMAASFVNLRVAKVRPISAKRIEWARNLLARAEAQTVQPTVQGAKGSKKASSRPVARPSAAAS
jgi:hypothetical protein